MHTWITGTTLTFFGKPHATHKTNRSINRATHKLQGYNIKLTTTQVQEAIKQCKNNNSQGPDKEPSSLHNSTHTKHRYKTQHSTVMALHTVNNTVAKGFN